MSNREIPPASVPEESEQPAAVESAATETDIGGRPSQMPRPDTQPKLVVDSSS
jgi:hypothetical protein